MKAVQKTCVLMAIAFFVQAFDIAYSQGVDPQPTPVPNNGTTATSNGSTTVAPKTTIPITTTVNPNTTTTPTTTTPVPTTTPITTTTSTTLSPPPIPPSPKPTTTTVPTPITTAVPPTPNGRHFDTLSFMGGIILTGGLMAISFILWKFYKARTERNYHTL